MRSRNFFVGPVSLLHLSVPYVLRNVVCPSNVALSCFECLDSGSAVMQPRRGLFSACVFCYLTADWFGFSQACLADLEFVVTRAYIPE